MTRQGRWALAGALLGGWLLATAAGSVAQAQAAPGAPAIANPMASAENPAPQNQALPTRQQLNPAGQVQARRRTSDLFSAPAPEPCALPDDTSLAFTLTAIEVKGSKALSPNVANGAAADLIGQKVTPAALCRIRDRLARELFDRGILARVVIPQQQITGGRVAFVVIEAQIVQVRYRGDIGPVQAKVESYLNHLRALAPFDLDTAQRYLLLANDIPGVRATASLSQSKAENAPPGALDLNVSLTREAVDELAAVQNYNSKTLGRWSAVGRVDLNSFTRFGERTSLIAYSTINNTSQQVFEAIEQARIGSQGVFAQGSFAFGLSHPTDVLAPLHLTGHSYVGTFEIDDPIVRLKRVNETLAAGFDLINENADFQNGATLSDDALRILWLRSDTAFQTPLRVDLFGDEVVFRGDLSLQVRKGLDILGASAANAPHLSRPGGGRADAWVLRSIGDAGLSGVPFSGGVPFDLSLHLEGQWADRPLLAYEEQAIGNLTVGRGYDPAAASGDRVIAGEIRLRLGPFPIASFLSIAPYGFYDAARVDNLDAGSVNVTVTSAGGGLELHLPHQVLIDVTYAKPFDKPVFGEQFFPPDRVLVRLLISH